jgi:hypothetical protein
VFISLIARCTSKRSNTARCNVEFDLRIFCPGIGGAAWPAGPAAEEGAAERLVVAVEIVDDVPAAALFWGVEDEEERRCGGTIMGVARGGAGHWEFEQAMS